MARSPVLVWRNVTRIKLIQAFRTAHGAPETDLMPGEPLICDGIELPLKHRKKRIDLEARGLIKGAQVIYLGPGNREGFAKLHVAGRRRPAVFRRQHHQDRTAGRRRTLHPPRRPHGGGLPAWRGGDGPQGARLASGPRCRSLPPTSTPPRRPGRSEAGVPLWKRLAYVAITRAETRLHWVVRHRLALPKRPLSVDDLRAAPVPLTLDPTEPE